MTHKQNSPPEPPNNNSTQTSNDSSTDIGTSDNLFLRLANCDDNQHDSSFLAYTCNNAKRYALTNTHPISNAHFPGIMIDSGPAYSSSGNEKQ